MLLGIFLSLLIANGFAIQNNNEVCSVLSICDKIAVIRLQVAAVREEQERQANILEGSAVPKTTVDYANDLNSSASVNNNELCTILSICNNLAALSSELAAVREEQERQADFLEESCQTDKGSYPANCYEALKESQESGVTKIRVPEYSNEPFKVACDQESHGGGWTIILRRTDGSEDFYRDWKDYQEGFGQVSGEYFVGLDALHALTYAAPQELLILMEQFNGRKENAMYDNFRVGPEDNNYTLESLGSFSGTENDGLTYHLGMQFSTKDRENDVFEYHNCAVLYKGAWWYHSCYMSNLAGLYMNASYEDTLRWSIHSLRTAIMMIRPKVTSQE